MRVDLFDFTLPDRLIALRPVNPRDSARMLVVHADGTLEHRQVRDLPDYLSGGDMVVVNDTKVISARLTGRRMPRADKAEEGPKIEITLHKRTGSGGFLAFAKPARKLEPGDRLLLEETLRARVQACGERGEIALDFEIQGADLDMRIAREGQIPLPPYIAGKRKPDARDHQDYQTLFARDPASVAAPTAGLHFTPRLLARLEERDVGLETLTLHVGAGTFLPVTADDTSDHRMHSEYAVLDAAAAARINVARAGNRRILAVGTTTLRVLESATDGNGCVAPFRGDTNIFITPGYLIQTADMILTNFHLPRSTLFMLVCAFAGTKTMRRAYAEAIAHEYRFYSYGDACLLIRPQG